MCHDAYWRRFLEAQESRRMWIEFEQTEPLSGPEQPDEVTEPEPTEAREEVIAER